MPERHASLINAECTCFIVFNMGNWANFAIVLVTENGFLLPFWITSCKIDLTDMYTCFLTISKCYYCSMLEKKIHCGNIITTLCNHASLSYKYIIKSYLIANDYSQWIRGNGLGITLPGWIVWPYIEWQLFSTNITHSQNAIIYQTIHTYASINNFRVI